MDASGLELENNDTPTPTHTPTPTPIPVSNTPSTHNVNATEGTALRKQGDTAVYTCLHCSSEYRGGGINRLKQHLAGVSGQVVSCKKVPHDVCHRMIQSLREVSKKRKLDDIEENYGDIDDLQEVVDAGSNPPSNTAPLNQDKRKASTSGAKRQASGATGNYFAPRTIPGAQPAIDAIAAIGPGFKGPIAYDMRVNLLGDLKQECHLIVDAHRRRWESNGCTLMADGWTNVRQRTLTNFLVHSTKGIVFVKSVDASELVKEAKTLFHLFSEVIEWIGPKNIIHVVTDNTANYVACSRLIHEKYRHIYWSSCAAHCLNLILKDIASLPHVSDLASKASKITIFVYNHTVFLSWLRKRQGWREIVRPGATRFATTFITLQSIHKHKNDLQALVVDRHFVDHKLSKTVAGQNFANIVLDNRFWNECYDIVALVGPLIRLLRIVDGDEKPSLGYVYEGMIRAKHGIKSFCNNNPHKYKPYIDILKARWDKHLKTSLHAAAYFLNPAFMYDPSFHLKRKLTDAILDLLRVYGSDDYVQLWEQLSLYKNRDGSFTRDHLGLAAKKLSPYEWWSFVGGDAPQLQQVAIRVLSQTSSSSGCERNWSLFERIHTKRRNRLDHQCLNDLVFTNYNLRLQHRSELKKKNYDPIDYASIDRLDFWIAEEEPAPEFNEADCDEYMNATSSPPLFDEVGFKAQSTPVGVRGQSTPTGVGVQSTPEVAISNFLPTIVANDLATKELNLNEFYGDD
ncbi:uncharacterized protein LOC129302885 [Prosopis cineraria]|uniref:uncharacterized protein LOC129302885 n=1 Tax=Prosopis cineraria TaxID=364024 RepID=UPI00240F70E7|nr:uncharacterized protein LOC129302885 [Prosopis cineraria]